MPTNRHVSCIPHSTLTATTVSVLASVAAITGRQLKQCRYTSGSATESSEQREQAAVKSLHQWPPDSVCPIYSATAKSRERTRAHHPCIRACESMKRARPTAPNATNAWPAVPSMASLAVEAATRRDPIVQNLGRPVNAKFAGLFPSFLWDWKHSNGCRG